MPLPHRRILHLRSLAMGLACSLCTLMRVSRRLAVHLSARRANASPGSKAIRRQLRAKRIRGKQIRPGSKRALRRRPTPIFPLSTQPSKQQITQNPPHGCRCRPTFGPHRGRQGWNRPAPARCCGHIGILARTCATRRPPAGLSAASFCSDCCKIWGIQPVRTPFGPRACRQTRQACPPLNHRGRTVPMWQTPMFSGREPCSSRPEA